MLLYGIRRYSCPRVLCRTLQQAVHKYRTSDRIFLAWAIVPGVLKATRRREAGMRSYYKLKLDPSRYRAYLDKVNYRNKAISRKRALARSPPPLRLNLRSLRSALTEVFFLFFLESHHISRNQWRERSKAARKRERLLSDPAYRSRQRAIRSRRKKARLRSDPVYLERVRAWRASRDARKRALAVRKKIRSEPLNRSVVYDRHGGVCYLCGKVCDPEDFHIDHVIPVRLGGSHTYGNCRPTHPYCNLRKGGKPPLMALAETL